MSGQFRREPLADRADPRLRACGFDHLVDERGNVGILGRLRVRVKRSRTEDGDEKVKVDP
jgi:hypothetical protein